MVPTEGVEPTRYRYHQILSLARLPIPPRRQADSQSLALALAQPLTLLQFLRQCGLVQRTEPPINPVAPKRRYSYTKVLDNRKHPIRAERRFPRPDYGRGR